MVVSTVAKNLRFICTGDAIASNGLPPIDWLVLVSDGQLVAPQTSSISVAFEHLGIQSGLLKREPA